MQGLVFVATDSFRISQPPNQIQPELLQSYNVGPSEPPFAGPTLEATDALRERLTEAQTAAEQFAASGMQQLRKDSEEATLGWHCYRALVAGYVGR